MSASNHNWVCFDCRFVKREAKMTELKPKCPKCGDDLYCLGYKVAIPKKENKREWTEIRDESRRRDIEYAVSNSKAWVKYVHETERLIKHQEGLEQNEGRRKYIKELKESLTSRVIQFR